MKINRLRVINFRTLDNIEFDFPSFYTAICGKNDSGKTNVIKAIRNLIREKDPFAFVEREFSIKDNYPKWKGGEKEKRTAISIEVIIDVNRDAGLYNFINTYLSLNRTDEIITFTIEIFYSDESSKQEVKVQLGSDSFEDIKAQEILKKLQASNTIIFHNSVDMNYRTRYGGGILDYFSDDLKNEMEVIQKSTTRGLTKIAKIQQRELTELLGRLESKYKVGLSLPALDLTYMPLNITLGDKEIDVGLNEWGSGTRNRTLILSALLQARRISTSSTSASKITPIIVVEEPESFLHPSAQAEFGKVLQDLSEEFQVQVIVTTHSPYMLSLDRSECNVLLERRLQQSQLRETLKVDTSDENWMGPFSLALGLDSVQFRPWKEILFNQSDSVLLVEGDIDKEYFDLLRDPKQGANQLKFSGEIYPYNGCDNLKNAVLLKFVMSRYKKVFITYDLDAEGKVESGLLLLGLQKNKSYGAIGINSPGKRNIEGLIPENIIRSVYGENPDIVQQALDSTSSEQRSAKNRLKRLILDDFKKKAAPGSDYYKNFYDITKIINKALI